MTQTDTPSSARPRSPSTMLSLAALGLGLVLGIVAHQTGSAPLLALDAVFRPVGALWIAALQMTVLPLVIAGLATAILANGEEGVFRRIGPGALALFVGFLLLSACFALPLTVFVMGYVPVADGTAEGLNALTGVAPAVSPIQAAVPDLSSDVSSGLTQWLISLIPTNPFRALSEGHLLPILLFTILFSVAALRIDPEPRAALLKFFMGVSQTMMVLVGWLLLLAPLGIFSLSLSIASGVGENLATVLIQYLVLICGMLAAFVLFLYPVTALLAGIPLQTFARAAVEAQVVAISTRSSLASLPALLQGAREHLKLPPAVADVSLPLAVSMFKVNRPVSAVVKLLFIAHILGLELSFAQIAVFLATIMIISFSAVGIPLGGNTMKSLPAYLAAGVPAEVYLVFKAVEAIPDVFKTLTNVTADMSVAAILGRFSGAAATQGAEALAEPPPAPEQRTG